MAKKAAGTPSIADFEALLLDDELGFLHLDAALVIESASAGALQVLRRPQAEVVGQPLSHLVASDERAAVEAVLAASLEEGHASADLFFDAPEGTRCLHLKLRRSDDGTVRALLRPLRPDSSGTYERIFQMSSNAIAIQRDDVILKVNPAFEALFGDQQQAIAARQPLPYVAPEDSSTAQHHLRASSGEPLEITGLHRNGERIPIVIQARPMRFGDQDALFVAVRDLRLTKEAEQELRLYKRAIEASATGILIADAFSSEELRITYVNPGFSSITGYSPAEVLGRDCRFLFGQDLEQPEIAVLEKALAEGQPCRVTLRNYRKDGTLFYNDLMLAPIRDALGTLRHFVGIITDVSSTKQAEAELQRREQLYRTLARNLPDSAIFLIDAELRFLIAEGPALILGGHSSDQVEGRRLREVLPDVDPVLEAQYLSIFDGEERLNSYQAGGRTYRVHSIPIRNDENEIILGMVVSLDVSSEVERAQALEASEQRNRALLNAIPDMLFVLTREGIIREHHLMERHPLAPLLANLNGTAVADLPVPQDLSADIYERIARSLDENEIQIFDYSVEIDGVMTYNEARMVRLNADEVLISVRDITNLKVIQSDLRQTIDDLVLLRQVDSELNDRLNMRYATQIALDAALRLGKASAGYIALLDGDTLRLTHFIGPYQREALEQALEARSGRIDYVLSERRSYLERSANLDHSDPALLPNSEARILVPLIASDVTMGLLTLETHIAERFDQQTYQFLLLVAVRIAVALENARLHQQTQDQLAELQTLYDRVSRLETLKTDMIRIASHDLRNPLSGIFGFLELLSLSEDSLPATELEFLRNIEEAAQQMRRIISGILSLEHIEQIAKEGSDEALDLTTLVRKATEDEANAAHQKNQVYSQQLGDESITVLGDPVQLHEAISNLISNAIKYTPENGRIEIALRRDGTFAEFRVTDTGYGIPEAQQERLFTPFFRARSKETAQIEGTGLGLHLVKNIIERHNGQMIFASTYGQGSYFGFRLPLYQKKTRK